MSEKPDRRTRKSRAAIFAALESLVSEKSYSSISVSDIIDRADVSRSTFYAHFQTKDAVLDELCRDIFLHVVSNEPEQGHSFSAANPEEQLLHVLYHLKQERKRLGPLFASPSSRLFWEAFQNEVELFFGHAIGSAVEPKRGIPDGLYAHCLAATYTEVAKWWFGSSLAQTPEEVLAAFLTLTGIAFGA